MKIFIDTLDMDMIKKYADIGIISGVTTNPTMQKKFNMMDSKKMVLEIRKYIGNGEIHVEAFGDTADEILTNSDTLLSTGKNLVFKIPFTEAGLLACKQLRYMGYQTNMHLIFSVNQAILAAVIGTTYICPLVGRLDDVGHNALENAKEMLGLGPKIMISSVRHPQHVIDAWKIGAHAVTIPPYVLEKMLVHPLTTEAIGIFKEDMK